MYQQYFEIRSARIQKLRQSKEPPNPYPHKFPEEGGLGDAREFLKDYAPLQKGEWREGTTVKLAGRIMNKRILSPKLRFYDIQSWGKRLQVMCQAQHASEGSVPFEQQHEHLRNGDIIGIVGFPGRTSPAKGGEGELSIFAREVILLTPCLRVIPTAHYGFTDVEQRFRQKFLDLIINGHAREVLITRHKITKYIRNYFDSNDFIEVETPMMNAIAVFPPFSLELFVLVADGSGVGGRYS